jgi:hypothetical protein
MLGEIEVSTKISPTILENYRKELLAGEHERLEAAKRMGLEDGIIVRNLAIKRYENADYAELFRYFVMSASEKFEDYAGSKEKG